MINFYKAAGGLILGTRLKRLSERFLQEVGLIYQELDISFEPSWFPIFFLLREQESLSMTDMASELDVSHSAISQMISVLRKRKLIQLIEDREDARRKQVSLTALGKDLLQKVSPVWTSMNLALPSLWGDAGRQRLFLEELTSLETKLAHKAFSTKTLDLVPDIDVELVRLDRPDEHPGFALFKRESEGRFLDLPTDVQLWLTLSKGRVIGALAMQSTDNNKLKIWQVFVQLDYRRKGLATAMIEAAIVALGDVDRTEVQLEEPAMPLIQLLIKAKVTFTVALNYA